MPCVTYSFLEAWILEQAFQHVKSSIALQLRYDCCLQTKTRIDMVHIHAHAHAQVAAKGSECLFGRCMTLVAQTANAGRAWQAQLWEDGCGMIALAIFLPSSNSGISTSHGTNFSYSDPSGLSLRWVQDDFLATVAHSCLKPALPFARTSPWMEVAAKFRPTVWCIQFWLTL